MQAAGATGAATASGPLPKAESGKKCPTRARNKFAAKANSRGFSPAKNYYLLAAAAGGMVLSEPIADAAPVGGMVVPDEPALVPELPIAPLLEPLPEGMLEPAGGVDGMVDGLVDGEVDGEVDGDVDGGLIGAGVTVSSIFLPQAPRTSSAESAKVVATGLK